MARTFKNSFSDVLIANPGSRLDGNTLSLDIRLPWYRSLPLSVVMPSELTIDGQAVSLDAAAVVYEGRRYTLAELTEQTQHFWFVQDSIELHVPLAAPLAAGAHEVALLLHLYPPYIPMLTWVTRGTTTLQAA